MGESGMKERRKKGRSGVDDIGGERMVRLVEGTEGIGILMSIIWTRKSRGISSIEGIPVDEAEEGEGAKAEGGGTEGEVAEEAEGVRLWPWCLAPQSKRLQIPRWTSQRCQQDQSRRQEESSLGTR